MKVVNRLIYFAPSIVYLLRFIFDTDFESTYVKLGFKLNTVVNNNSYCYVGPC